MSFKCGTVSVVGKANVGKSSFINAVIKEKVSIVSPKPQTTRNNIIGVYNSEDCQIVFIDTPGIYEGKDKLGEYMTKSIKQAVADVDVLLVMIDGSKEIGDREIKLITENKGKKIIVLVSKIDLLSFERLYPKLSKLNDLDFVEDIIPFSSNKNKNIDVIIDSIKKLLPESSKEDCMFSEDEYTDKSVKFIASETIREKALWLLQDEIPHGIGVQIVSWQEETNITTIHADIICDRESHKSIIIGKKGEMLGKIGSAARLDIEKILNCKVNLQLFVKVKEDWKNNPALLNQIGYNRYDIEEWRNL